MTNWYDFGTHTPTTQDRAMNDLGDLALVTDVLYRDFNKIVDTVSEMDLSGCVTYSDDILVDIPHTYGSAFGEDTSFDRANRKYFEDKEYGFIVDSPAIGGGLCVNLSDVLRFHSEESEMDKVLAIFQDIESLTDCPVMDERILSEIEYADALREWEEDDADVLIDIPEGKRISDYAGLYTALSAEDILTWEHDGYNVRFTLDESAVDRVAQITAEYLTDEY